VYGRSVSAAEVTQIGEGFVGDGAEVAHVNTVLGRRGGPLEAAWATALATPRAGHVPFVVVAQPNVAVQPPTLFVNKAPLSGELHERLTWGAAQAGVAAGVGAALSSGTIAAAAVGDLLLIAAVWVSADANDAGAVFENNREATRVALEVGARGGPRLGDVLDACTQPANPYFPV
jgi:5,6,7,8-tetrahydromethanopterin hydro-lyase